MPAPGAPDASRQGTPVTDSPCGGARTASLRYAFGAMEIENAPMRFIGLCI